MVKLKGTSPSSLGRGSNTNAELDDELDDKLDDEELDDELDDELDEELVDKVDCPLSSWPNLSSSETFC
jgi:phosphopantothenoylcysteine synthetase/decarboxylase